MTDDLEILAVLKRHGVPCVVIGGHAVNFHGYGRTTEDTDLVWVRSPESETKMLAALVEIDAKYIGREIDPATGIEKMSPVTSAFVQSRHLMMLVTRHGFLDLFDYVPGLPDQNVEQLLASSVEVEGIRYASLKWLRQLKQASGRDKDRLDLENLPG